jgi:hypothetical protein
LLLGLWQTERFSRGGPVVREDIPPDRRY